MATTFDSSIKSQKVVRVNPISEEIRRLRVISCDICEGKAAFDVYVEGVISEVNVLKRYCENCIKDINQQMLL